MKIVLTACLALSVCICGNAQQTSAKEISINEAKLTKQLNELLEHAQTGFEKIKGEPDKKLTEELELTGDSYFKTTQAVDGSVEKYIEVRKSSKTVSFKAYFGKNMKGYSGKDLFKKMADLLKKNFTDGFNVTANSELMMGDYYETLRIQKTNDTNHYAELTLSEVDNTESIVIDVYLIIY
jgi:Txe/YoeB family toxin of Txe-Axe toxin-antitoxin module